MLLSNRLFISHLSILVSGVFAGLSQAGTINIVTGGAGVFCGLFVFFLTAPNGKEIKKKWNESLTK